MNDAHWKCPVCGFEAKNAAEQDQHMKDTGHTIYADTEDKGKETPPEPTDLEYSHHSGYTPGVSTGDVRDESDDPIHNRAEYNPTPSTEEIAEKKQMEDLEKKNKDKK